MFHRPLRFFGGSNLTHRSPAMSEVVCVRYGAFSFASPSERSACTTAVSSSVVSTLAVMLACVAPCLQGASYDVRSSAQPHAVRGLTTSAFRSIERHAVNAATSHARTPSWRCCLASQMRSCRSCSHQDLGRSASYACSTGLKPAVTPSVEGSSRRSLGRSTGKLCIGLSARPAGHAVDRASLHQCRRSIDRSRHADC